MDIHNKIPLQQDLENEAIRSVLGEEDPGAALEFMSDAAPAKVQVDIQALNRGISLRCNTSTGIIESETSNRFKQFQKAISRWENEGGARGELATENSILGEVQTEVKLTNAELVQLQIRVIALENLVIALLACATDQTPDLAREMAIYISPRPGYTPHHLTIHAASQMVHLVERSIFFHDRPSAYGSENN